MNSKEVLVCIDRDGTLIYDDEHYLGHTNSWKKKVSFLNGVVKGIKKLKREISNVKIYMVTNQKGVAIKDFKLLTKERAEKVCKYIVDRLKEKGAEIDGYVLCPHADTNYKNKHPDKNLKYDLVCNCSCIKPNTGMIDRVLSKEGLSKNNTDIFVLGDRVSDVEAGLNAGGYGVLVPFENQEGQVDGVKNLKSKKKYVSRNFMDGVEFILKKEG